MDPYVSTSVKLLGCRFQEGWVVTNVLQLQHELHSAFPDSHIKAQVGRYDIHRYLMTTAFPVADII